MNRNRDRGCRRGAPFQRRLAERAVGVAKALVGVAIVLEAAALFADRTDAEAQRVANEQAAVQAAAAAQAATAQNKLIADYKERIKAKIQRGLQLPPNIQGNPEAEFDVVLLPDGNTLGVKLKRTSGNTAYDNAVERAILKAQPLPLPPDQALFRYFRELNLAFRPQQ